MSTKLLPGALRSKPFPKLFNAKRRIEVSKGLLPEQLKFYKENPVSEAWRNQASKDVVEFVDKVERPDENNIPTNELLPEEKYALLKNPVKYFGRPQNVPNDLRQQIYFPQFAVTLLRTPHLGPKYAQFKVPLWFGKLDLKSYLSNLYNVEVTHIRSFVVHQKKGRKASTGPWSRGQRFQPSFKKRMTVQLVEPFVWPDPPSEKKLNGQDYQQKVYWDTNRFVQEDARKRQTKQSTEPDEKHRKSIAQQARDMLTGKTEWNPTWQQLPSDVRVLGGARKNAGRQSSTALSSSLPPTTSSSNSLSSSPR